MRAIHWIRSLQEELALDYWLSIVAFERKDRSVLNRLYLLYLFIFFAAWIFSMLTFFASGGALLLHLFSPVDPRQAAVSVELLLLGAWSVYGLWKACRRSPVVFSEADEVLICQMPVNRRCVISRWIFMPWIKTALVFWVLVIILGFTMAEISMPGIMGIDRIPEYAIYGLRPWLAILPIQFGIFALQWAAGIFRLQKGAEKRWLGWVVIPISFAFFATLFIFGGPATSSSTMFLSSVAASISFPLQVGFTGGSLGLALLTGTAFGMLMFALMIWVSGSFSLSRAAQETREEEELASAAKYGMSNYAEEIKTRRRLGVKRTPSRLPALLGAGSLVWKGLLQSRRTIRLGSVFSWISIFVLSFGIALLPNDASRYLAISFWVIRVGQISVVRLRNDLSLWPLTRQLPVSSRHILLADLLPSFVLLLVFSLAGIALGSAFSTTPLYTALLLIPGLIAGVAGISAYDVIQRSRSNLLLVGSVPIIGVRGILLGMLITAVVILASILLSATGGIVVSLLMSVLLAWFVYNLAGNSLRRIKSD